MIFYTPPKTADHIPVIDFSDAYSPELARREAVAWEIHKACRDVGFFYLANHGVPQSLIDAQFAAAAEFFALPRDTKEAIAISKSRSGFGYEPMSGQTLDTGTPPDLKEGFQCGMDIPDDHPYVVRGLERYGLNQWPAGMPAFREQCLTYHAAMMSASRKLLSIIALSLDIAEDFFQPITEMPIATLRMLHYPPQAVDAAPNQLGAGAHTDWGLVTLLAQDSVGGLEVRNADGEWILATPIPGTFVINIGQMMERFTAGIYRANLHRVRNGAADVARYSVATFFELEPLYRMGRAPTCPPAAAEEEDGPDLTIGEHIEQMARASYAQA
jgi:isopenicillin N synthase-like dioxygenase